MDIPRNEIVSLLNSLEMTARGKKLQEEETQSPYSAREHWGAYLAYNSAANELRKLLEKYPNRALANSTTHKWKLISSSLSGYWECELCGQYATGDPHDGSNYFPEKGQEVTPCLGKNPHQ